MVAKLPIRLSAWSAVLLVFLVYSGVASIAWYLNRSDADISSFSAANSGASLVNAQLRDADLAGADLRNVDLTGADLSGAVLAGAQLQGADLTAANLTDADLRRACLQGSRWKATIVVGTLLDGADLRSADLSQVAAIAPRGSPVVVADETTQLPAGWSPIKIPTNEALCSSSEG